MKLCTACLAEGVERDSPYADGLCPKHHMRLVLHDSLAKPPRVPRPPPPKGSAYNHTVKFTPELWEKWRARQYPHAAHLRQGIEHFRRALSARDRV
jgi:hypothetical protein